MVPEQSRRTTMTNFLSEQGEHMKKVLIKDLVIPAGTVFVDAPTRTDRISDGCVHATFGLTNNTSGSIEYWIDSDEEQLHEWFRDLK